MTYGWNRGQQNPRRGDAVLGDQADDPDLSSWYGDPDGLPDRDSVWARPSDPVTGPGRTSGRAGGFGRPGAQGNADAWMSGDTAINPVSSSHWQPGYEPLGHPRPGSGRAGDGRPDDASPGNVQPGHAPYQPPGYAPVSYQRGGEPSAGDDPGPFGYQPSDQPAGDFYQPPGAADVLSYGYRSDPADAAYQRSEPSAGGASALSRPDPASDTGWFGQPDWVREPDTGEPAAGEPEFVLHGPAGPEPGAGAGRSFRASPPRRGAARGRHGRVWLGVGALLVIAVAAVAVFYGKTRHSGQSTPPPAVPAHTLATPQAIGAYSRDQQAERVLDLSQNQQYVKQIAPGHVSGIVAAVYDTGGPASSPDRVAITAGRLLGSAPADVIKSFMQQEASDRNAPKAVPAGPLGGQAVCAGTGKSGICLWADANTVGVLVSATINPGTLAQQMLSIRSGVEIPAA